MFKRRTRDEQDSCGDAAVERFSDGDDVGVVGDSTAQPFYVTEGVVIVAGQRVAVTPSQTDLVGHGAKTGLPRHRAHVALTLHCGLHVVGGAGL